MATQLGVCIALNSNTLSRSNLISLYYTYYILQILVGVAVAIASATVIPIIGPVGLLFSAAGGMLIGQALGTLSVR